MREPVRLLALDVDGTLLTSRHEVTPGVAAAVRRAVDAGLHVVLASARPPSALLPVLRDLADPGGEPPAAIIASQGALTGRYDRRAELTVLAREPMAAAAALALVRALPPGVSANWFSRERWLVERLDPLVEQEAAIVGVRPEIVDLAAERDGPDKVLLLAEREATGLLEGLALPAGLVAVASTPTHLEVTRAGVDKASALARLCARLGVAPAEVAAMGDGHNDLPLLAFAGIAVTPGNAAAEVLRAADIVTASNDEDGVAEAIAHLLDG
jgi:hypothetical protein